MNETIERAAITFADKCRIANVKRRLDHPYDEMDMRNAFEEGAQWQAKQSPWISVEERLPESDNDLYIALSIKMTPPGIDVCEFDVKSKRWTDSHHVVVRPTHWMSIPYNP